MRIVAARPDPDLVRLPWSTPLEEWGDDVVVPLPRGLSRHVVRNQDTLRRQLAARGITATQATISRDIKDLKLVKRASDGAYQKAGADDTGPSGDRAAAFIPSPT